MGGVSSLWVFWHKGTELRGGMGWDGMESGWKLHIGRYLRVTERIILPRRLLLNYSVQRGVVFSPYICLLGEVPKSSLSFSSLSSPITSYRVQHLSHLNREINITFFFSFLLFLSSYCSISFIQSIIQSFIHSFIHFFSFPRHLFSLQAEPASSVHDSDSSLLVRQQGYGRDVL